MRKSLFFILLATGAVPALAAQDSGNRGEERRAASAEQSGRADGQKAARAQRSERSQRAVAVEQAAPVAPVQRVQRSIVGIPDGQARASRRGDQDASRFSGRGTGEYSRRYQQSTSDGSSPYAGQYSGDRSGTNWRDRTRNSQTTTTTNRLSNWNDRDRDRDDRRWSNNWRRDNRYNWRSHRNRYSSLYRLGRYHDPFGYGYRRFSIGLTLGSGYYGSNYWLNDPWQYRLPPAYGPYRWIRYYDDALLVNIYSGEVVDVIYGFFW